MPIDRLRCRSPAAPGPVSTAWPATSIRPVCILSRPAISISRVDLPLPDGPTSAATPPGSSMQSGKEIGERPG